MGEIVKVVSVDERGRVQLPKDLRERLKVKIGERLVAETVAQGILLKRARTVKGRDPLLWDLEHPVKTGKRLTKKRLDQFEEEQWSG